MYRIDNTVMATRSPPPLVSAPNGPTDRPTTTISTIVVKAGEEAFLTVGLLQSGEFARLRIDEMRPPLLSIGKNEEENTKLLNIHQNLLKRLKTKEEECESLLARAAAIPVEKEEDEAKVYTAMAKSLDCTWRELLRRLHLRENLLIDINSFYRLLASHEEVSRVCISAISSLSQSQSPDGLARQIGVSVNEIVDITARAMESGSSVMGQLRIIGELSDNYEREQEIYEAMLVIEGAMLKMASEWNHVEDSWVEEKKKRMEMNENGQGEQMDKELEEIGMWLAHAGKRLKASTEEGMKTILAEAEEQRTRLIAIISQSEDDRKLAQAGELARGVEELLALTRAALNKGSRLRNFFVSATNMYHQLVGMERDMEKANESMAGELAPLARQKGTTMKEEADAILERERVTHDERRMIINKRNEIMEKIEQIEKLAQEKSDSGKMQARDNLRRGREWLVREAEPWMDNNGFMGGNYDTSSQFIHRHSQFGETIIANDAAIQFALNESTRLNEEEQRSSREFEERYNRLKSQLEQRIHLGKTFLQVNEFARELEASFDSLEQLIDQKAEHSERGLQQMGKVFEMIEDTLGQERAQGERFISSATSEEKTDTFLKTEEAKETVREILVKHERRFTQMAENWNKWHQIKRSVVEASRLLEEVQMWQEESMEIIRLWDEKKNTIEKEEVSHRMEEVKKRMGGERERVESVRSTINDESTVHKLEQTLLRQREIEEKMQRVQNHMMEEERIVLERQKALESSRQEVSRVIEDIQMWQEEKMDIIRLWENQKEEKKEEERKEIQKKSEEIKIDLIQQNDRIEKIKSAIQDDETSRKVFETVQRQQEISERIDGVKRKIIDEERIGEERKMKESTKQEVSRGIEVVQMWQHETIEVIRLWENKKEEKKEEERKEIQKKSEEIKMDLIQQNDRIERIKPYIQDEETNRRVLETVNRQREISDRIEGVKRKMIEEERIIEQRKKDSSRQEVNNVIEEVQMWQNETMEIIRLWENQKEEKKEEERKEIQKRSEEMKIDLIQQNHKIEIIKSVVQDEEMSGKVLETVLRQREISERIDGVKKRLNEEERFVEDKKKMEEDRAKQTVEEIEMWQEEIVTILRLWEDYRLERSMNEKEEINKSIEAIGMDAIVQAERLQTTKTIVKEQEWQTRISSIEERQKIIGERLEKIQKGMKEENEERARIQREQELTLKKTLEEIEMWQDETVEIIKLWSEKKIEEKKAQIEEVKGKMEEVNIRIQQTLPMVRDEVIAQRVERIAARQNAIIAQLKTVEQQLTKEEESLAVESVKEIIERPKITTQLIDISIEEGKRVEFVAKIQSKPEATVLWLKDGKELEQTMDYRKSYVNGVATLSIEETFIEDSAFYTIKAKNEGGESESTARLTVTALRKESEPPRMVRGLKSTAIEEGERLFLDCVVVAKPEPQVVWFKEESTIKEDERTRLDFKGDHCSLTLNPTTVSDSGMYTAKAKNIHGEATSLCQVKVSPKKVPPPTPPKPERPDSRLGVLPRPPAMQCTLTNETYQEGMKAVLQVLVSGSPRPSIQWYINDTPVTTTERVKVTIEDDGWTRLIIDEIREDDTGLYMVVAENEMGEARTGATLHVQPKLTMNQVKKSFEEASGSEHVQTVIDVLPPTSNRMIEEKITVIENGMEKSKTEPTPSSTIIMETKTNEEYKQKDESQLEVHPVQREEINTTSTTVSTTSTSHIPIETSTRTKKDEFIQGEIGLSNTSTVPDIIRPLHKEYTFNEEEELFLEVILVANPRPKIQWFFNDNLIPATSQFAEMKASGDSYSLRVKRAALENAGYYRIRVENVRGDTESLCIVHIRPLSLGPVPKTKQHVTVQEEFAMFEYEQRRPEYLYESRIPTLKTTHVPQQVNMGLMENKKTCEYLEGYDLNEKQRVGNPPHFTQTLLSTVTADGSGAKFEGIVTGWPAPEMEWSKDGIVITRNTHPHITVSNIGGRVSLNFSQCAVNDSGKYKCTASNEWGVATSSAQLVVRPKTVAPDFISRLISEEIGEGETLKWTVRVTGDPLPSVVWLRDGIIIPNCDEVKIIDEGLGVHSMVIHRIEMADSGQFTCLAENSAGEARSTADLVVRPEGAEPGHYFHVTKVTQEKQVKGQPVIGGRNEAFAIESPMV